MTGRTAPKWVSWRGLSGLLACAAAVLVLVDNCCAPLPVPWLKMTTRFMGGEGYHIRIALPSPTSLPAEQAVQSPRISMDRQNPRLDEDREARENPMLFPLGIGEKRSDSEDQLAAMADKNRSLPILKVNYSIDANDGVSAIEINKPIEFNGVSVGSARLRIADSTSILINSQDVLEIGQGQLEQAVVTALTGTEFVKLERLRSLGLAVRYDATGDRVLMSSSTP